MIARVLVLYEDDQGRPVWGYNHAENIPFTNDPEQMALTGIGLLVDHMGRAKASVVEQARVELKTLPDDIDELLEDDR